MSVSLQKGQKVSLTKDNTGLNKIMIGLGWDATKPQRSGGLAGLFGMTKTQDIDCDASVLLLQNGKLVSRNDIVYFGNLKHSSHAVIHQGDNLTGDGEGDDEQILVELSKIPPEYDRIVLVVNIYQAVKRQQHFGMIANAFCRLVDMRNNQELCRYNLTEDYSGMYAMIFGELYRHQNEWKFNAIGQGTQDPDLGELSARYTR